MYTVKSRKVVAPTEVSVLDNTEENILTLITCTPPGTAWKRLIIIASLNTELEDNQNQKQQDELQANKQQLKVDFNSVSPTNGSSIPGSQDSLVSSIADLALRFKTRVFAGSSENLEFNSKLPSV